MNEDDRQAIKARVREIIERYQGPALCVTKEQVFVNATGETVIPWRRVDQTRIIRSLVEELRQDGCPIGFKGGRCGGYFWARNDNELASTINTFHSRAMSGLRQEAALRRIPMNEVIEQHKLELKEQDSEETNTH
ncbi:MAG TPA: hypothetical protein ENJ17_01160 [Gammaproteobacteria bacterium]|nr:hypothetical protein [Gammaproteobacteria bacterium]